MNLENCTLCPKKCHVNRNNNEFGYCMASNKLKIARFSLHFWEEPPISMTKGSGTIFFSNCNLKCIYCQNYEISTNNIGKEISIDQFCQICLNLQQMGALNINLVTPTHFIPLIKEALVQVKKMGLTIPIIYNTNSYENVVALKSIGGLVDVYLPDLKYCDDFLAIKYSNAKNYFEIATNAIAEMYRQVGKCKFNKDGSIKKGVIVRHLVLPTHKEDSKKILKYLHDTYKDNIYISIMNQYTPIRSLIYDELNCKVDEKEYNEILEYAIDIGIKKAFIQEDDTQSKSFIPDFTNYEKI